MDELYKSFVAIAADGPAGSGKSTVSGILAGIFNKYFPCVHVDTGAFYRAVGYFAEMNPIDVNNVKEIENSLQNFVLDVYYDKNGAQHVIIGENEIPNELLRLEQTGKTASKMSAVPSVRSKLLDFQRALIKRFSVIMDGRDIGTVVLPDADVKLFITADVRVRAKRRFLQLEQAGNNLIGIDEILHDMLERDTRDSERKIAPCVPAHDAVILDTSNQTVQETVAKAYKIIFERCEKLKKYNLPEPNNIKITI